MPDKAAGTAPTSAETATHLALERTYLAGERTLMGWIRTALSMISFGFTIGKLGQILHEVELKGPLGHTRTIDVKEISFFLVALALLAAAIQHRRRVQELTKLGFARHFSIGFIVAILLVGIGLFAFVSLAVSP